MTPGASEVGMWVLIVMAIIPSVKILADWVRPAKRSIEPQPLEVRGVSKLITSEDCEKQHQNEQRFNGARFDAIEDRLKELISALEKRNTEGEERARGIHKRVDVVASDLAAVRGRLEEHIAHGRHEQ